jgi:putative DNA modification/repair radical SAM protein
MIETLRILREEYGFNGYIHTKAIPGADSALIARLGLPADRISVNIELPSQSSLRLLAPEKTRQAILEPMGFIRSRIEQGSNEIARYKNAPKFAPAGQSTQMIVGASGESDLKILKLTEGLYKNFKLKRVFFFAYILMLEHALLPAPDTKPPLMREHRLYQADWLLRFYGFSASELLDDEHPDFNPFLDPKCNWALRHPEHFPVEVNRAPYEKLLRVPGIGVRSAQRIVGARRMSHLCPADLKKLSVVLKRAQYFITCAGKRPEGLDIQRDAMLHALLSEKDQPLLSGSSQLSLFENPVVFEEELQKCLSGQI